MRPLHRLAAALAGLVLAISAMAAPQPAAQPPKDAASQAEDRAEAEKFKDPEIKAALVKLYLEKLRTETAEQRAAQRLREAETQRHERWVKSLADDLSFNNELFRRQLDYHPLILGMVLVLVGAGLWFSYLQFTLDHRAMNDLRALAAQAQSLPPDDPLRAQLLTRFESAPARGSQTFEVGPLKVSSPVIGLMVLAMSLAFFFVYIDKVYIIRPATSSASESSATAKADAAVQAGSALLTDSAAK
jgi:hypothetical protein